VRRYPHDLFKSVTKSHDYLADLEQRLSGIKEMPALLIFGNTDGTIKMGWLARLEGIFPRHRSIIMRGSHHFPQIYDPAAVAAAIRNFWDDEVAP
jgi:haloalkane dehalogenase